VEVLYSGDPFGVAYLVATVLLIGFQCAAEFRGAAPGRQHPALGPLLEPPGPAERPDPAQVPPSLRLL